MVETEELLVGDEMGFVYYYSVEWPAQDTRDLFDWHGSMTLVARISCHSQQICGLAWSPDGNAFATGGNDNQLFLHERKRVLSPRSQTQAFNAAATVAVRNGSATGDVAGQGQVLNIEPSHARHVFSLNAAVKALAFAPWQPTLLAAGGGSNDRCIHFFHTLSGAPLATIDCHAQVTSLVWSPRRRELAATFGFAQPEHAFRVAVFAWPSCELVVRIPWWSEERALYAVAYPRGPTGGAAMETTAAGSAPTGRAAAEGGAWCARRAREEGCLVVATSDASIKFHEIWAETGGATGARARTGLGAATSGSPILEGECSDAVAREGTIR